jgi:hypothetical protein
MKTVKKRKTQISKKIKRGKTLSERVGDTPRGLYMARGIY